MSETSRRGQVMELQSIRGLAAMVVVLGHATAMYGGPGWWIAATSIFNGRAAVGMFFVLSGYVLTRMLQGTALSLRSQIGFGLRRIFRIYPTLIVATALSLGFVLLYEHLNLTSGQEWFQVHFTPARLNLQSIVLAFTGFGAHLLPQAWTITIELIGSFLMPSIAWLAFNRARVLGAVLVGALVIGLSIGPHTPYATLMYMPHFIIGSLLYALPARGREMLRNLPAGKLMVTLAAIIMVGLRGLFTAPYNSPMFAAEELACATFLIAMIVHGNITFGVLRAPIVEWIGNVSYSLYLFHFVVICFTIAGLNGAEHAAGIAPSAVVNGIALSTIVVLVTLPLSAISLSVIEGPGNELGRRLVRRLDQYDHRESLSAASS